MHRLKFRFDSPILAWMSTFDAFCVTFSSCFYHTDWLTDWLICSLIQFHFSHSTESLVIFEYKMTYTEIIPPRACRTVGIRIEAAANRKCRVIFTLPSVYKVQIVIRSKNFPSQAIEIVAIKYRRWLENTCNGQTKNSNGNILCDWANTQHILVLVFSESIAGIDIV